MGAPLRPIVRMSTRLGCIGAWHVETADYVFHHVEIGSFAIDVARFLSVVHAAPWRIVACKMPRYGGRHLNG